MDFWGTKIKLNIYISWTTTINFSFPYILLGLKQNFL